MIPESNITNIMELTKDQLVSWLKDHDIEAYHANQIMKWIYFRLEISQDGSKKYLFKLRDGQCIESVLIPEKNYYTLCISSQVGCSQGYKFCLTAKGGFVRNLTQGEILVQVRDIVAGCMPKRQKNDMMNNYGRDGGIRFIQLNLSLLFI